MEEKKKGKTIIKETAYLGMFVCFALILSYVEVLIPFNIGIPGVKIGLANAASLFVLYKFGIKEAYIVNVLRILLSCLLFSGFYGFVYSIAAGLVSLSVMVLLSRFKCFSEIGVSVAGGVVHNLTQLLVAGLISGIPGIAYYFPFLTAAGAAMGFIIGLVVMIILRRLSNVRFL